MDRHAAQCLTVENPEMLAVSRYEDIAFQLNSSSEHGLIFLENDKYSLQVCRVRLGGCHLRHDLDPNYKLLAARALFTYAVWHGEFLLTDEVASYTASALGTPGVSDLNRHGISRG